MIEKSITRDTIEPIGTVNTSSLICFTTIIKNITLTKLNNVKSGINSKNDYC